MMELLANLAHEIGDDFNTKHGAEANSAKNREHEVLTHLHGRGCRISKEILALLSSGYPSGALARWRGGTR